MITLITGGPGLGKTALVVKMIQTVYAGKTVFSNIRGLVLEHSPLPHIDEWTREEFNAQGTSEYRYNFPPGSVVIIDECQQFFRPRSSGTKVPPIMQAFETHRQEGVDFVLMTQGTNLIDFNLKALIKGGKHIHLRTTWLGRYSHEASECIAYDDKSALALTAKRKYKLPSEVFDLYKSAELHTKPPKVKLPVQVYIIVGLLILGGLLTWRFGSKIESTVNPSKETEAAQRWAAKPTGAGAIGGLPVMNEEWKQEQFIPAHPHYPESAAAYRALRVVVNMPTVSMCLATKSKCQCYTEQGTRLPIDATECRSLAETSRFDPYRVKPAVVVEKQSPKSEDKTEEKPPVTAAIQAPVEAPQI